MSTPEHHRVGRDVLHMLRLVFTKLEQRGYRRIGFLIRRSHEAREEYATLGSYLAHEWKQFQEICIPPLIEEDLTAEAIVAWYRREQPDLVFTMDHLASRWLKEAGFRIPQDLGFFVFNCYEPDSKLSGIYPEYEMMGAAAVEQVSGLLERAEFGVPNSPRTLLVSGKWCEGESIKPGVETGMTESTL